MNNAVEVCQSDYIAADDLGGKVRTLTIASVQLAPEMPGKKTNGKRSKSVLITFEKARKGWIVNTTNQWSIALLLGTKNAREWVGRKISLHADMDIDIESGQPTACIRVQGSPDASPDQAKAYAKAWQGKRERGALCKRVKRAWRYMALGMIPAHADELEQDDAPVFEDEPEQATTDDSAPDREPGAEG